MVRLILYTIAALAVLGMLAACQSGPVNTCGDNCTISMGDSVQERGGNSPSTLNPPISAEVRDSPVAVNSGADQSRDAE